MKKSIERLMKTEFKNLFFKLYMIAYRKIKGVQQKKVVFVSFSGKTYSDNPKAISEALHALDESIEITWLFIHPEERKSYVPDYVKVVKLTHISQLKEHATAKVWVDNFTKPLHFHKSKEQLYIQTWHGDRGFKKVLHDSTFIPSHYRILESDICDIMVSASDFCDHVYRSAFKYSGEILKVGSPRNDALVKGKPEMYPHIRSLYGLKADTSILLYAPTLRRASEAQGTLQDTSQIDLSRVLDILESQTRNEWVCFVRAHVSIKGLGGIPDDYRFIDVSSYEDMADILLATDFLVTDYSSSAGDFALLNRPVLLFQNDRKEYIEKDRTFYFELDDCPFYMVENQVEFEKIIPDVLASNIEKNCNEVLQFYHTIETGESSLRIAEMIVKHCTT